jgi:putative ABC transport system permease protein
VSTAPGQRSTTHLRHDTLAQYLPDLQLGFQNLLLHKLRTLLTMLGMIFGVAAVVSMLSIGAGAQQQVMAFIEQLGVRNLIVEAREPTSWEENRNRRKTSPGLSLADLRVIRSSVEGVLEYTPRKKFTPTRMLPKPERDMPTVFGVLPNYQRIAALRMASGRFFTQAESDRAAPVCVLGEGARASLFGIEDPVGKYLKVNEQWFHVVGAVGAQLTVQGGVEGVGVTDMNNLIYVPVSAALLRLEDSKSGYRDEIDGIYMQLASSDLSLPTADVVRSVLTTTHRGENDFSVVVPAELLAEQRRTQRIFDTVMVAIASISLLVGGIGIMNIMLASILERTREIGVRRALGARQKDIVRQFLIESVLISFVGGVMGIAFGIGISHLISWLAGWNTVITPLSVIVAFVVSVSVGLVFGIYPATKAARLDPVEAIRYE